MATSKPTVAIGGAGDTAKYLVEELAASQKYDVVVLSRADRPWFSSHPAVSLRITDYSHASILSILNSTSSTILFSFLHSNDPAEYNVFHANMLSACAASSHCKHLVPSEYGGNIDDFPTLPRFYEPTHAAFREVLRAQDEVEWTLVNHGWFADYFVPDEKTYMKNLYPIWPIDLKGWKATVLGTGDEPIGWTAARDVAKALVRLIETEGPWERHTYVAGEIGTWNKAVKLLESWTGRELQKEHRPTATIQQNLAEHADDSDPTQGLWLVYMDEWNVTGASTPPMDQVLAQRRRLFEGIHFRGLEDLLRDAETMEKV